MKLPELRLEDGEAMFMRSKDAIKATQKAVEMCLSDSRVSQAVVVCKKGFRAKVSKMLYNKVAFDGDLRISLGKLVYNEMRRVKNIMRQQGIKKMEGICYTKTTRRLLKEMPRLRKTGDGGKARERQLAKLSREEQLQKDVSISDAEGMSWRRWREIRQLVDRGLG